MMNKLESILKIKQAWDTFTSVHPKFPMFLNAVKKEGIKVGTVIEVSITSPEGKQMNTNIKVTESDLNLFETLKDMGQQ